MNPHTDPDFKNYKLYGVVINRGSAHGGHYLCFVRDLLQETDWQSGLIDAVAQVGKTNKLKRCDSAIYYSIEGNLYCPASNKFLFQAISASKLPKLLMFSQKKSKFMSLKKQHIILTIIGS